MWEFARVGQPVSIITVTDRDLEDTGRQVVNITDGNQAGHFALDSVGGVHVVRLARQLDRQTVSQYQLTITAQDGGTPARTATATLRIIILPFTCPEGHCCIDGEKFEELDDVPNSDPCQLCQCIDGSVECATKECVPPDEFSTCVALPPLPGQCCPTQFECEDRT